MSSTKDIAKQIRQDLKEAMKDYTFSVRIETFSGGSSISVGVMTAPVRMIRTMDEIPAINDPESPREQIVQMQVKRYHQLSQYQLRAADKYRAETWNNGVFLTEAGHNDLKKIVAIVEKYHRDDSDSSIDYFNCNFYFHLNLGKWDKEFIDGATNEKPIKNCKDCILPLLICTLSEPEKVNCSLHAAIQKAEAN